MASDAASAAGVKDVYADDLNSAGNIVIVDGSRITQGRSSHISVGCIVELYSGVALDHVVFPNFCLRCALGPKPDEESYSDWYAPHEYQRKSDGNAGRMEMEAALFFQRSLAKSGLQYTTIMCDGDSRTFRTFIEVGVEGFIRCMG